MELKGLPKLIVHPVSNGAARCYSQDSCGVPTCGTVVIQLGIHVAEEEGQRQSHNGGNGAGELEMVEGVPVRIREEQDAG